MLLVTTVSVFLAVAAMVYIAVVISFVPETQW